MPVELAASAAGAREQLFIAPPPVPQDAVQAEQYARNNGLAFLPTIACSPELLNLGGFGGAAPVTAFISSPAPGQAVTDAMAIIGTAQFSPQQAQYYKIEIVGGQFGDWTPLGDIHSTPVVNGQLETLFTPALNRGTAYRLRLVIVGLDANWLQAPYEVEFFVP